jgi:hypothetical protein
MTNYREITIQKTENGFILKEHRWMGETRVFQKFKDLLEWIRDVYEWGKGEAS